MTRGWRDSAQKHLGFGIHACAWLVLAAVAPVAASAQDAPPSGGAVQSVPAAPRPKIGLALSGGGARGAAHVGVLKALEELHVPIDYIAGTSMGAIVGALYASGKSPEEIEQILLRADWDTLFTDKPPRKDVPFRKKQDDRKYLQLQAGFDWKGVHTGKGVIVGQHLNAFLETLMLKSGHIEDFGNLPIPFRCVATDIATGEKVVLTQGHLAQAIRASMSIPAVFTPVEIGDHLLVDGGLTDNLPVDIARAMGADVVIAVDISTPPLTREQLKSILNVTSQMINILMQKNVDEQAKNADFLIRPDIKRFSNMNFKDAGTLIPIGKEALLARADDLRKYAVPADEYAANLAAVRSSLPPLPKSLDFVRFEGTDKRSEAMVRGKLSTKPGAPFDAGKVSRDLDRVYAAGEFDSVTYRLDKEGGKEGLVIKATPNPLGPNVIRFGIQLSTDFKNESNWAVLAGLRMTRLNGLGAEWKSDLEIGLNRKLYTEFYQPLDSMARWFVAPSADYFNVREDIYASLSEGASYRIVQGSIGADLGLNFGRYGEIRVGPRWGHVNFGNILGPDFFGEYGYRSNARLAGIQTQLTLDHLNSADFPTQGYLLDVNNFNSLKALGADDDYRRVLLRWRGFGTRGRNTFFAGLVGGSALGSDLPPYAFFQAGGFDTFAGYETGQLIGRYFGVVRLGYSYRIGDLPPMLGKGYYLYFFTDTGNTWLSTKKIGWNDLKYSGTLAFGTETRLGPLYLGYSRTNDGNSAVTFYMGKRF
jgi:NTE family protein